MEQRWWEIDDWRRRIGLPVLGLVATVALGALIGSQLGTSSAGSANASATSRLEALAPGTLEAVPKALPTKLDTPLAIGSEHAGIAVVAVSEVDSIGTAEGRRRAPDGGSLVVFRVTDWSCEITPCKAWTTLKPRITHDGLTKALPGSADTYVIALPPGSSQVRLMINDAGHAQSVSLLDDDPGAKNIDLLAQKGATKKITLDKPYRMAEHTSIGFKNVNGAVVDQFVRNATVETAQRRYFFSGAEPSEPGHAFLIVSATYAYAGGAQRYAFASAEATFIDDAGNRYAERGVRFQQGSSLLSFEIPASVTSGTLVLGGSTQKTASNGVPYTSQVAELRQELTFD